jgi:hypothetical protein
MDEEMMGEPAGPGQGKNRIVIAIVAIIIIAGIAVYGLPTLLEGIGPIEIPGFGEQPTQMLIIGEPSVGLLADLDNERDLVYYRVKDAAALEASPKDELAKYEIVLLDQHLGLSPYDKSVSRALGEAIEEYVGTGGKLIVVMDSGIYRSGGVYGTGVAADVVGWESNFGDIIPVECDLGQGDVPNCTQPIALTGKVHRAESDHAIMKGIEVAPADPRYDPLSMTTFNVNPTGNQIAYIKHVATASNYPAIVEKKFIVGKVVYFNYDPAMTPGIWQNTLEYLG